MLSAGVVFPSFLPSSDHSNFHMCITKDKGRCVVRNALLIDVPVSDSSFIQLSPGFAPEHVYGPTMHPVHNISADETLS